MTRQEIEREFASADPNDYLAISKSAGLPLCDSTNLPKMVLLLREIACQLSDLNAANATKPEPKRMYDSETDTYRPLWAQIQHEWQEALDNLLPLALGPSALNLSHIEGPDQYDKPALFLVIVMPDNIAKDERRAYTARIRSITESVLGPRNYRSLEFYFSFTSASEFAKLQKKGK